MRSVGPLPMIAVTAVVVMVMVMLVQVAVAVAPPPMARVGTVVPVILVRLVEEFVEEPAEKQKADDRPKHDAYDGACVRAVRTGRLLVGRRRERDGRLPREKIGDPRCRLVPGRRGVEGRDRAVEKGWRGRRHVGGELAEMGRRGECSKAPDRGRTPNRNGPVL